MRHPKKKHIYFFLIIIPFFSTAQISYNLQSCEAAFRKHNLSLLTEQYNIEVARANVIQAKIWELPVASAEFNTINPEKEKILSVGKNGQKALAVQQLIYLGGKKKNEIEFAKSNVRLAELSFEQLLRNLRFQLIQNFYSLYFNNLKITNISSKIANIDSLVASYSIQTKKGNVPLKDLVRLQSLSFNLRNQFAEIQKDVFKEQEILKILTNETRNDILPVVNSQELSLKLNKQLSNNLDELQLLAVEKNLDYQTLTQIIENDELFLRWQKSLAKPDISLGLSYDQRGGAFQNQINVTASIPLALWNRNKGNILVASTQLDKSKAFKQQKESELKINVETALKEFSFSQNLYLKLSADTQQSFEAVYNGVMQNFQKRNISLIEFTDIIESYIESTLLINEVKKQVITNGENLNYLINEQIF